MNGDTMHIVLYNLKTGMLDKTETYYAKNNATDSAQFVLEGKQSYYADGKLICEEIMQDNTLKESSFRQIMIKTAKNRC